MRFNVSSQVTYTVNGPSTLILNVHAIRDEAQTVSQETFIMEPKVKCEEFVLEEGQNRFVRIETGSTKELQVTYQAQVETHARLISMNDLSATPLGKIDRNIIPFLYPSRYCQSDKLGRLAYTKFGKIKHPFQKVTAIAKWIHKNVQYLSGSTNSQTSAFDTVTERVGVCRDFAHLGIALCRALNIPARYFAGYAHRLNPPDFHACFEAYVGGCWLLFDPTRLAPVNGLVRIAKGRDAAEASVATIFGPANSTAVKVSCEPAELGFSPLREIDLTETGVCFDAP